MTSIKVVLTLLAALSCFNLSEGQVFGEAQREATQEDRDAHFRSQVEIKTLEVWHPEDDRYLVPFDRGLIESPPDELRHVGSGTLLNNRWILSAAHLFIGRAQTSYTQNQQTVTLFLKSRVFLVRAYLGNLQTNSQRNRLDIERVILHHDYKVRPAYADIALLRIKRNHNIPPAWPANLPVQPERPNMRCKMSGWGQTDGNPADPTKLRDSAVLRWADTRTVPHSFRVFAPDESDMFYAGINEPDQLRAALGRGDSGGGLLCQRKGQTYLYGVATGMVEIDSSGRKIPIRQHGRRDLPVLYTSVYQNLQWITDQMDETRIRYRRIYTDPELLAEALTEMTRSLTDEEMRSA